MLQSILSNQYLLIVYGIVSMITGAMTLMWSKYPVRWLLAIATVGLLIATFWVPIPDIDPRLPGTFAHYFRLWFFLLAVASLYLLVHFIALLIHIFWPRTAEPKGDGTFPDIDAAWQDILIQLSQARIAIATQPLYLLLTPDEELAAGVIDAAGLELFARAPAAAEAALHGYAVADALFLSCAGASILGKQTPEGTARLEYLCRLIAAENPTHPTLRGVAVLLPIEWATAADSFRRVAAVRDDLQTIRRTFKVRCPTLTVICLRESMPGFNEFASRLPVKLRHNRCGFSVPTSRPPSAELFRHGMQWMTQWFQSWSLNLMVQDVHAKDGNNRLLSMIAAFRGSKNALARLLESALMLQQQAEPMLYRGCYFVACGPEPDKQAFAAGLLNGARARLLADRDLTTWSDDAEALDRGYRKGALVLGAASALIALPIWYFGIIARLAPSAVGMAWLGWLGLVSIASMWAAVLLLPRLRRRLARAE